MRPHAAPTGAPTRRPRPTTTSIRPAGRTTRRGHQQRPARREQLGDRHVGRPPGDGRQHGGAAPIQHTFMPIILISRFLTSTDPATVGGVAAREQDAVDRIVAQWTAVRPDLDSSPIGVIGRVSRLSRLIDAASPRTSPVRPRELDVRRARHVRRSGPPYELTAGMLVRRTMVTTGAITNRIDRLAERGLVERSADADDRRKVIVRLTAAGLALVDEVAEAHMAVEREILGDLSPASGPAGRPPPRAAAHARRRRRRVLTASSTPR